MKQHLLLVFAMLMAMVSGAKAQTTQLLYPSLGSETGGGFIRKIITNEGNILETDLWKRIDFPAGLNLGYVPAVEQRFLKISAVEGLKSFKTDVYAILDAVNLEGIGGDQDVLLTFWNSLAYEKGETSTFSILATDQYTGDPANTHWVDLTATADILSKNDNVYVKSTINLNQFRMKAGVVIAFRYTCSVTGDNTAEFQAGTVRVGEVKITSVVKEMTALYNWQFNFASTQELVAVTKSNDAQKPWERVAVDHFEPNVADHLSLSATAAYKVGTTNMVAPMESWAILQAKDLSGLDKVYLRFWNIMEYYMGGDSKLLVKMSYDHVGGSPVTSATWIDITSSFILDKKVKYDKLWSESVGEVSLSGDASKVSFAFVYVCTDNGTVDPTNFRPVTVRVGDVVIARDKVPTGITNLDLNGGHAFYPNPCRERISFDEAPSLVEIFDLSGKCALRSSDGSKQMNVASLQRGVHIVRITFADGRRVTQKLVKQ